MLVILLEGQAVRTDGRASRRASSGGAQNSKEINMPENYTARWYKAESPATVPPAEDTLRLESLALPGMAVVPGSVQQLRREETYKSL